MHIHWQKVCFGCLVLFLVGSAFADRHNQQFLETVNRDTNVVHEIGNDSEILKLVNAFYQQEFVTSKDPIYSTALLSPQGGPPSKITLSRLFNKHMLGKGYLYECSPITYQPITLEVNNENAFENFTCLLTELTTAANGSQEKGGTIHVASTLYFSTTPDYQQKFTGSYAIYQNLVYAIIDFEQNLPTLKIPIYWQELPLDE